MKGIMKISSARENEKDSESIVAKIIEFEIMDRAWFEILRNHPDLNLDSNGKPLEFERNCRIHCKQRRHLNKELLHPFSDMVRVGDLVVGVDFHGSVRALDTLSDELREVAELNLFELDIARSPDPNIDATETPIEFVYAPVTSFRIAASQSAAHRAAAAASQVSSAALPPLPEVSDIPDIPASECCCHSRLVLFNLTMRDVKKPEGAEEAASAAKKKGGGGGKKGDAEKPPTQEKLFFRILVLDLAISAAEEDEEGESTYSWHVVHELMLDCPVPLQHAAVAFPLIPVPPGAELDAQSVGAGSVGSAGAGGEPLDSTESDAQLRRAMLTGLALDLSLDCRVLVLVAGGRSDGCPSGGGGCSVFELGPLTIPVVGNRTAIEGEQALPASHAGAAQDEAQAGAGQEAGDKTAEAGADSQGPASPAPLKFPAPLLLAELHADSPLLGGERVKLALLLPDYTAPAESAHPAESSIPTERPAGMANDAPPAATKVAETNVAASGVSPRPDRAAQLAARDFSWMGRQGLLVLMQRSARWALLCFRPKSANELHSQPDPSVPAAAAKPGKGKGAPEAAAPPRALVPLDMCMRAQWTLGAPVTAQALDPATRSLLALGLRDGSVSLWSLPERRHVDALGRHPAQVTSLSVHCDPAAPRDTGVSVVSGALDGTVCFYMPCALAAPGGSGGSSLQLLGQPPSTQTLCTRRTSTTASCSAFHMRLAQYRSDVREAAVLGIMREQSDNPGAAPLVLVQYSNGAVVAYECCSTGGGGGAAAGDCHCGFLVGRLEKHERVDFQDVVSTFSSYLSLPLFQDPHRVAEVAVATAAIEAQLAAEAAEVAAAKSAAAAAAAEGEVEDQKSAQQPDPNKEKGGKGGKEAPAGKGAKNAKGGKGDKWVKEEPELAVEGDDGEASVGMHSAGGGDGSAGEGDGTDGTGALPGAPTVREEQIDCLPYNEVCARLQPPTLPAAQDKEKDKDKDSIAELVGAGLRCVACLSRRHFIAACQRNTAPYLAAYSLQELLQQIPHSDSDWNAPASATEAAPAQQPPASALVPSEAGGPSRGSRAGSLAGTLGKGKGQSQGQLRLTEERLAALEVSFMSHEQRQQAQARRGGSTRNVSGVAGELASTQPRLDPKQLTQTEALRSKHERSARKARFKTTALELGSLLQ